MPHLLKGAQFFSCFFFILIMTAVVLDEIGSTETIAIEIMKGNFININEIIDHPYNQQGNNEKNTPGNKNIMPPNTCDEANVLQIKG